MKKLVKTAKQQFEERLSELTLIKKYALSDTDLYYLCENEHHDMSILREIHDKEFYEQKYSCSYSQLINDEEFLRQITLRFIEHHDEPVKPLFDWYASADKEEEPFTLDDIWMCNLEEEDLSVVFSDLYEEVPDVRIITAEQQFEARLKEVGLIQNWVLQGSIGRIGVVDKGTKRNLIFVHEDKHDAYTEFVYPSFEELRKDSRFCLELLRELVDNCDDLFFKSVSRWIHFGGDCPLDPVDVYFCANHLRLKETVDFEDKELPQEQTIQKIDFSTEITEIRERMIAHIKELYEQGMVLDSDSFLENAYSITWEDGSYYACENLISCKLTKSDEGVLCFSEIQVNDKDVTYDSPLSTLTINTLWSIIDSMR